MLGAFEIQRAKRDASSDGWSFIRRVETGGTSRALVHCPLHHPIKGRIAMAYRVYSGPRGVQRISPLEKERLLYKEFDTLDGALSWARHVNDAGRTALSIEGDDGTIMRKQDIAAALRHPETEAGRSGEPAP